MLSFVPEDIERYVKEHSTAEPVILQELSKQTHAETDAPEMLVGPVEGLFLKLLARSTKARNVLEIGTFTGYSAMMLAEGLAEGGEVITCDIDPKVTKIARSYWDRSQHGSKITLKLGPAEDTIKTIEGPLDLVFIDADKESYIAYWEACIPKLRSGGVILADNVLWSGKVLNPEDPTDHALAAFNEHVTKDKRVETVMLAFRDGITMAVKH